jgi:hypothetical protein
VAPPGSDFVTATSTEFPQYILRDPPGDNSYAFLEEGRSVSTTIEYQKFMLSTEVGVQTEGSFGLDEEFFIGLGAGTIKGFKAKAIWESEDMFGSMVNKESKTEVTVTTKQQYSTSPGDLFVGEGGDAFIGAGFNFIFSRVSIVDVEDCEVIRSTSIGYQPDSISTTFAYTQQYIEDVLIPEYDFQVWHYDSLGHADSAGMFQARADDWRDVLAKNDSLKLEAELEIENRSFSAGADYSYFYETDTTEYHAESLTLLGSVKRVLGLEIEMPGFANKFKVPVILKTELIPSFSETTEDTTVGVGYVLGDDDIGDHFTVDIKYDGRYPSPVFDVLAGVSSCPYEPWPDPESGEARMLPRDSAELILNSLEHVSGISPFEPAAFNVTLSNQGQTHEIREYVLREVTTCNPHGAVIRANGVFIAGGTSFFINGDPGNNSNQVMLTVERGPFKYDYQNLAVVLYPPCEYSIWEQGGPMRLSDTLFFSVTFDAPCSDVTLLRPSSSWVYNVDNVAADAEIELLLTDYELEIPDKDSVQSVGAEYRRLGTAREAPSAWELIGMVIGDDIDSAETKIFWTPETGLEDGVYELRAFTNCGGVDTRTYSNLSVGTIDRQAPVVFGTPEPADGELSLGEDISITFNESIDVQRNDRLRVHRCR